jgi:hypothetical protein
MGRVRHRRGINANHTWLAAAAAVLLLAGCASGGDKEPEQEQGANSAVPGRTTAAPWDRPENQDALVRAARLVLYPNEHVDVHYHAHRDVLLDGDPVPVPGGLGINVGPNGSMPEHGAAGIAALHTHDTSGVLHIESPRDDQFTLGQLFRLWDVRIGPGQVGSYKTGGDTTVNVFVDGKKVAGHPAGIVLEEHQEIAVAISTGTSDPAPVPSSYDFPSG